MRAAPDVHPAEVTTTDLDDRLLLDVREPWEWAAGHIPGSVHIPMADLGARLDEINRTNDIVVVCRSGSRSDAVATALDRAGYRAVNLLGGVAEWQAAGHELVDAEGAPGRVV